MNVYIGSDHGGFDMKEQLKPFIESLGYMVVDFGTYSKDAVDYPDFAYLVADKVSSDPVNNVGIMIDGAGMGSAMVANKVPGVRAAACYDTVGAKNSREHNAANMLTLGSGLVGLALAKEIVKVWLSTKFAGGRHSRRIEKMMAVEGRFLRKG